MGDPDPSLDRITGLGMNEYMSGSGRGFIFKIIFMEGLKN